jgi:hypothetical protein
LDFRIDLVFTAKENFGDGVEGGVTLIFHWKTVSYKRNLRNLVWLK